MDQLVAAAPAAAADVDTRVSITFDPAASPAAPKTVSDAVTEAGQALTGLESALGACGVTVLGRARAADIAGVVRTAFDPAVRGEISRLLASGVSPALEEQLNWASAGPAGAEERWDCYQHDSGISVSYAWREAPRQNVRSDVLARLVGPGPYPKRVSLQYRPLPAAEAARTLDSEVRAAQFRSEYARRTRRDVTARDAHDQARARQAADEEARGAGVSLLGLYVTVTVTDPGQLARADRGHRGRRGGLQDPAAAPVPQPGRRIHRHLALRHLPARTRPPLPALTPGDTNDEHPSSVHPSADPGSAIPEASRARPPAEFGTAAASSAPDCHPAGPLAPANAAPPDRHQLTTPSRWLRRGGGRSATAAGPCTLAPALEYQATTTQLCGLFPFVAGSGTPGGGHSGRAASALGRGRLPRPAGVAARRAGHQPRDVRPRPARHRQVRARQAARHRSGGVRHPGAHPGRHQAGLHPAGPPPRRAGDPDRPGPGPDQPSRRRATRRGAAHHDRARRGAAPAGGPLAAPGAAAGAGHADPGNTDQQRRGSHPRPGHRPPRGPHARRHRSPTVTDVLRVIEQGPDTLRSAARADTAQRYADRVADLVFTLDLLCTGSLAGVFDGATSQPINLDAPAVSVDISAVKAAGDKLLTAAMLCTWSYGFGCVDAAAALAADRRRAAPLLPRA